MRIDAKTLLTGPRGRRLCLQYAVDGAFDADPSSPHGATVLRAAFAQEPANGTASVVFLTADADTADTSIAGGPASVPVDAEPGPDEAAAALAAIALAPPTHATLRRALAAAVDAARYWQEPDGSDVLADTPVVRDSLRRVAELIAASPDAAWWSSAVATDDQWVVPWSGGGRLPREVDAELAGWLDGAHAEEERALRERPVDPTANWGGVWWSIPPSSLVRTTRRLFDGSPAGLWFVEDSLGGDTADATPVDASPAHVIEIDGPEAWADLCRRHPLEVTASRRHDWYRTTGRDGSWVQPDWSRVARETDGVHLSVAGYLATAGRAIEVDGARASVLAGWNPDETWWFRGVSPRPAGARQWVRADDEWEPATG